MKTIIQLIDEVIQREGGYVHDPRDRGGETNFGITEAVAREEGYTGPMRDMPKVTAMSIYRSRYWFKPGLLRVSAIAPRVAAELFDTGINMGTKVAAGFLQRALNALNRRGRDYPDLDVDSSIGPATLAALQGYMNVRGEEGEAVLLKALEALQGERYIRLAERRAANEAFVYGWLANRIGQAA